MLISEFVVLKVNACNIGYYRGLGYIINKMLDETTIKVCDLSKESHAKVLCSCDNCEEKFTIQYRYYHEHKIFCRKCQKRSGRRKYRPRKPKPFSYSETVENIFNQKCISLEYWGEKNENPPSETGYYFREKRWFKCLKTDYHEEYLCTMGNFIFSNSRCPYCKNRKTNKKDSLGYYYPEVTKIWSNENELDYFSVSCGSHKKIWWKCESGIHEDYLRSVKSSVCSNFRCPSCSEKRSESILQEKVRLYLEHLGYSVLHEDSCTLRPANPKTGYPLRYDNEILDLRLIIEVNGQQHYEKINYFLSKSKKFSEDEIENMFQEQKTRDEYKKYYAIINGYNYLVIPYNLDNSKESWKKNIDIEISNILNKSKDGVLFQSITA